MGATPIARACCSYLVGMSALDGYWLNVVSGDWGKQVIMIADVLVVVAAEGLVWRHDGRQIVEDVDSISFNAGSSESKNIVLVKRFLSVK